jgi:type I restriction enzyme S subunit
MRKDWKYGILDDAVDKGSSNISLNKIKDKEGDYPVYGAQGIVANVSFFQQSKDYLAIIKDGAGIGRISKHPKNSSILGTMQYIIPKEGYDIDFVKYFLSSIDFEKHRNGSTIPHVYYKDYKTEPFPLLTLPEQKYIVSILDKAFAAIDKAKANVEQNLNNAKELFESYLQIVFNNGYDWEHTTLGQVCSLITDGKHGNCKDEENSGYYFLSAKDVRNDTLLFENGRQIIESDFMETHRRTDLKPGDICLINTGATIGRMAFAPEDARTFRTTFQKSVAVIKTIPEKINNKFCAYLLKADLKSLVKISAGTAVPNLLLGDMKKHKISIPKSLEVQEEIESRLDLIYAQSLSLQSNYQRKLANIEELKKSILHKAFNGEL